MYPFQWNNTYIPVINIEIIEFLQAPLPFMLGCHRGLFNTLESEIDTSDVIIVDLDQSQMRV